MGLGPSPNLSKARDSGPVVFGSRSLINVGSELQSTTEGKENAKMQVDSTTKIFIVGVIITAISPMKSASLYL